MLAGWATGESLPRYHPISWLRQGNALKNLALWLLGHANLETPGAML